MNKNMKPKVKRKKTKILRDTSRVITRFHVPDNNTRIPKIINRVLCLAENEAEELGGGAPYRGERPR